MSEPVVPSDPSTPLEPTPTPVPTDPGGPVPQPEPTPSPDPIVPDRPPSTPFDPA